MSAGFRPGEIVVLLAMAGIAIVAVLVSPKPRLPLAQQAAIVSASVLSVVVRSGSMSARDFTTEQVDLAIDYVTRHGAENRAAPVHYTLVFAAAGLPAPQNLHQGGEPEVVTRFMEAFHVRCLQRDYPPLDSLVVNVAGERGGAPGAGYFRINSQPDPYRRGATDHELAAGSRFLQQQRDECRAWGDRHRRSARH